LAWPLQEAEYRRILINERVQAFLVSAATEPSVLELGGQGLSIISLSG
jgi:hypothetical protein